MRHDFTAANKGCGRNIVSWTQEEDDLLREQVSIHGCDNWGVIAARFKDKTGRQCWRRWFTYLNTESKKGGWSREEDMLLCQAQRAFGNRWTHIAKMVLGRTDNAVKNRFSILCKRRAKDETLNKENEEAFPYPCSKKVFLETPDTLKKIRSATHGMQQVQSRPALAVLNQNIENDAEGTFLRRNDPKLTALLQQAELLSSVAVKVNAEVTSQSLDGAWKELQDYLFGSQSISGIDFQQDDFNDLFEDITSVDSGVQTSFRENSHSRSEMCTGSTHLDQEKVSLNCNEGISSAGPGDLVSQDEVKRASTELNFPTSEFYSPLKTVPPFTSFTEEIPSPEFSASERRFLLSILGKSSTKCCSGSNQTPSRMRESYLDSSHSPSCKKVLLNSL